MKDLTKDRLLLLLIYLVAFGTAFIIGNSYQETHLMFKTFMMVLAAVIVIWLFSVLTNNSSVFDPYWSIAPPLTMVFFWWQLDIWHTIREAPWSYLARNILVFLLVIIYSIRLTGNFLKGWKGFKHEDWRYREIRKKSGALYWAASFAGIHFFPALLVFFGCLSLGIITINSGRVNFLDILGLLVTGNAIWLEATADRQLRRFINNNPGTIAMKKGLWALSRHPNYMGEMGFWWGLFFFALAANASLWWAIIGPVSITLMFLFISIPMMEKRLMERKSDYADYKKSVSRLIPLQFRRTS